MDGIAVRFRTSLISIKGVRFVISDPECISLPHANQLFFLPQRLQDRSICHSQPRTRHAE